MQYTPSVQVSSPLVPPKKPPVSVNDAHKYGFPEFFLQEERFHSSLWRFQKVFVKKTILSQILSVRVVEKPGAFHQFVHEVILSYDGWERTRICRRVEFRQTIFIVHFSPVNSFRGTVNGT